VFLAKEEAIRRPARTAEVVHRFSKRVALLKAHLDDDDAAGAEEEEEEEEEKADAAQLYAQRRLMDSDGQDAIKNKRGTNATKTTTTTNNSDATRERPIL